MFYSNGNGGRTEQKLVESEETLETMRGLPHGGVGVLRFWNTASGDAQLSFCVCQLIFIGQFGLMVAQLFVVPHYWKIICTFVWCDMANRRRRMWCGHTHRARARPPNGWISAAQRAREIKNSNRVGLLSRSFRFVSTISLCHH